MKTYKQYEAVNPIEYHVLKWNLLSKTANLHLHLQYKSQVDGATIGGRCLIENVFNYNFVTLGAASIKGRLRIEDGFN